MKNKETDPDLSRIWLLVPNLFLRHFDKAVQGTFPSRSEAIRRGMKLVLEELRQFNSNEDISPQICPASPRQTNAAPIPEPNSDLLNKLN
jgi:metal-responsive CopG/Arc/MetJ family transcriptional regulator